MLAAGATRILSLTFPLCCLISIKEPREGCRNGVWGEAGVSKPKLLLVNCVRDSRGSEVAHVLNESCAVRDISDLSAIEQQVQAFVPHVLCFEYDYPTVAALTALQETKIGNPALPIIMVTKQHSEQLAVWAFRSRVWDYLVSPVSHEELWGCIAALHGFTSSRNSREARDFSLRQCEVPSEVRVRHDVSPQHRKIVDTVTEMLDRMYKERVSQEDMAVECGMSPSKFSREFKRIYGVTFQEYLLRRRITRSMQLLRQPMTSITDICYAVGFSDLSHFNRSFRRFVGTSPSKYKQNLDETCASVDTELEVAL